MTDFHEPGLDLRLLGPLQVTAGGVNVAIGSPKQRVVLAMLALGERTRVDELVEELWCGSPPASVAITLQTLVSRLRRTLQRAGTECSIRLDGTAYVLELDPDRVDVRRFETLVLAGRRGLESGEPDIAARSYRQALALWRGPALADLAERDFARPAAARLEEARLEAVEGLADAELAAARPAAALETVQRFIPDHLFRERLRAQQMLALYRLGRQAEALAAYQELRRTLADDLGLDPSPDLQALERRILVQSPRLQPPAVSSIPPVLSSFVGRTAELAELVRLLRESRLLTITGLGGSGKTRLAFELAARAERGFDDGACVVELASVSDGTLVAPEILAALGVPSGGSAPDDLREQLVQVLAARHLLLVLDNCEHVSETVAPLIRAVLVRCPRISVLVTSREVLGVPGETTWPAPGLSLPPVGATTAEDLAVSDAARLFVERARQARPGFGVGGVNAPAIAHVCRRLDGLPLALELAAARVRVLSVAQLADRLDDQFRLLSGSGRRALPSRHQTMRAAMDWSFDLLAPAEQHALIRLSVFPQDFDLEAATAVAGGGADELDVLDLVARLVDKSLVLPSHPSGRGEDDRCRYRLLETVRQYAAERLARTDGEVETRLRHRHHFVSRIESARQAGQGFNTTAWALAVAADRGNFHAALGGALAEDDIGAASVLIAGIWTTWFWFGPIPTIPPAVASIEPEIVSRFEPAFHVQALLGLAGAGWITGRFPTGALEGIYALALEASDQSGDRRDQGFACYFLGYLARGRGDLAAARTWTTEALARWTPGLALDRAWAHYELGWIEVAHGRLPLGQEHFRRGLAGLDGSEDDLLEIHLRSGLGLVEAARGHAAEGLALAGRAVESARRLSFPSVLVMALVRSAETAAIAGMPSAPDLVEALRLLRDQGTRWWVAAAVTVAALAREAEGQPRLAARLLGGAAELSAASDEAGERLPVVTELVAAARGRIAAAVGAADLAAEDAAGRRLPLDRLLDTALDRLAD